VQFFIDNWYLILLVAASGVLLLVPTLQAAGAGSLTPTMAVQLINRQKAVVVDVGDAATYAAGHLGGAKNIPAAQLKERLASTVKNKSLPLILVCTNGSQSQKSIDVAKELGYANTQALAGGLKAWREANLPVQKS
jgi:rhodanese-related sulfurtransferase